MRSAILILTSAVLLATVSCDGDDKPAKTMCKGVYADKTLDDLTAGAATSGACTSAADLSSICANDVNDVTSDCALACDAQGGDDATKIACTMSCVQDALNPPPSDPCVGCYLQSVACALANCFTPCAAGAADPACTACRVQSGCAGAFYNQCSGLPLPTGLVLGAGGAANGGAAGSTAGGASNGGTSGGGGAGG